MTHHIIHDLDRDGWGSAALLVAELGPERCRLYPTRTKDVRPGLGELLVEPSDHLWVLDIAAPPSWSGVAAPAGCVVTWVDHHLPAWTRPSPSWIEVFLPTDSKPTTTMSLLTSSGIVELPGAVEFVKRLCSRDEDPWGLVFDGLSTMAPDFPAPMVELPALLAAAPRGGPVPDALQPAVEHADGQRRIVVAVLDEAPTEVDDEVVVVRLDDARGVPLARYSLEAGRRWPGCTVVLVHRGSRLYCGRPSRMPGMDFVEHFRGRGLDPKGHAYVCTVQVPRAKVEDELAVLKAKLAGGGGS